MEEAKNRQRMQENFSNYACVYKFKCLRGMLFPDAARGGKVQREKGLRDAFLREAYEQGTTSACLVVVYVGTTAFAVCVSTIPHIYSPSLSLRNSSWTESWTFSSLELRRGGGTISPAQEPNAAREGVASDPRKVSVEKYQFTQHDKYLA